MSIDVKTLRANIKVLNLWNGTTNVAPPANWYLPGFDDSAWSTPPALAGSLLDGSLQVAPAVEDPFIRAHTLAQNGVEAIWATTTKVDKNAGMAWRWTFTAPPAPYLLTEAYGWAVVPEGISHNGGPEYINGASARIPSGTIWLDQLQGNLASPASGMNANIVFGGANLFASMWAPPQGGLGFSPTDWPYFVNITEVWLAWLWRFTLPTAPPVRHGRSYGQLVG